MDAEFRVIDPDTNKPRAKGTEGLSEADYQAWKRQPWWARWNYKITFPRVGWLTALIIVGAVLAAVARWA
jgi:hypothetical protein